jgi:two-component system, sensor histidine kinase PdtaS
MKFVCWLILSASIPFYSVAQSKTDSLKSLLVNAKREGNVVYIPYYLSQIGWQFQSVQHYDSALFYYYQSVACAPTDLNLTASNHMNMGVMYDGKGFMDSSLLYYSKALKMYSDLKDTVNIIRAERNLAILYKNSGVYEKALEKAFSALAVLEKQKPDRVLASSYNTIADVYLRIEDYPSALLYHRKALHVRKQIDYKRGIGQSYSNIGEVFIQMHQYDSALTNLFQSIDVNKIEGDTNSMGSTFIFVGEAYMGLNKLKEAESYLIKALKIKKKLGERPYEAIALNNLGEVKLFAKDLKQAERYLNEAEEVIKRTGALDELRKNLELKVALYKAKPDYVKALAYAEELIVVKDSLLNKSKLDGLLAMEVRYEAEKKEQHIILLEKARALQVAEINTKRQWIQSLVIIITLLFTMGGILFYSYRQSQRNKSKVETLLQELHHRVKNNLQILSSVLSLQSQYITDETAIQVVKSSESRVNAMALIHKKLYGKAASRSVEMKEYIQELVNYLIYSYGFDQKNLEFVFRGETIQLDVDKAIPLGLILNEVVSNALKYAYGDCENPVLTIEMKLNTPNELRLVISDNGPGFAEAAHYESSKSFGLKMVNTLTRELKGKITTDSNNGLIYTLYMPTT